MYPSPDIISITQQNRSVSGTDKSSGVVGEEKCSRGFALIKVRGPTITRT